MSKYLTRDRKEQLKQKFSIDKDGYDYWSDYEGGIRLTYEDICRIHDFLVFMSTEEYNLWMKNQKK